MTSSRHLHGSCACERYKYVVEIPAETNSSSAAQVLFDRSRSSRIHHDNQHPLTPYVRIPLPWYHSSTHAFFPDESHTSIRRVFHHQSPFQHHHLVSSVGSHIFCGFCGTNLTFWTENPPEEKDWIYAHLDTLRPGEGLKDLLDALDTPPNESEAELSVNRDIQRRDNLQIREHSEQLDPATTTDQNIDEMDWFTTMLQTSHLGNSRMVKSSGVRKEPGGARVEWDIVEILPDGTNLHGNGKRKLEDVEKAEAN